jgi:hypothetical protein
MEGTLRDRILDALNTKPPTPVQVVPQRGESPEVTPQLEEQQDDQPESADEIKEKKESIKFAWNYLVVFIIILLIVFILGMPEVDMLIKLVMPNVRINSMIFGFLKAAIASAVGTSTLMLFN